MWELTGGSKWAQSPLFIYFSCVHIKKICDKVEVKNTIRDGGNTATCHKLLYTAKHCFYTVYTTYTAFIAFLERLWCERDHHRKNKIKRNKDKNSTENQLSSSLSTVAKGKVSIHALSIHFICFQPHQIFCYSRNFTQHLYWIALRKVFEWEVSQFSEHILPLFKELGRRGGQ